MSFDTLSAARPEQVWAALAQHVQPGRSRSVPIDAVSGCTLAADVRAAFDYPPFDRAVMDGYAVRTSDLTGDATELTSQALAPAGRLPVALADGSCVQINTGAPLPPGADAIVIVERSERLPEDRVRLHDRPPPGANIERQGAIRARGDVVVASGARVGPGELAALIAGGAVEALAYAKPHVALLSTGDELVERGRPLRPGQIHDSNAAILAGLIRRAGGEPEVMERCADDATALRPALELGLTRDVLIVSGGMSAGTHDLTPRLLEQLGVAWLVTSLDLKPGKPTRIGRTAGGCWVLGLPGNPVSCAVCFMLFGAPLLGALQGHAVQPPPRFAATLDHAMPPNGARPMYQPARWRGAADGRIRVTPCIWHGSGDPFGLVGANALIVRAAQAPPAASGDEVEMIALGLPA